MRRRAFGGDAPYKPGVVYYAENIVLDGTNYIDTGIKLLSRDYDFDIELQADPNTKDMNSGHTNGWLFGLSDINKFEMANGHGGLCFRNADADHYWQSRGVGGIVANNTGNWGFGAPYHKTTTTFVVQKRGNVYTMLRNGATNAIGTPNPVDTQGFVKVKSTLTIGAHKLPDGTVDYFYSPITIDYFRVTIIGGGKWLIFILLGGCSAERSAA